MPRGVYARDAPVWREPGGFTTDQLRAIKVPTLGAFGDRCVDTERATERAS